MSRQNLPTEPPMERTVISLKERLRLADKFVDGPNFFSVDFEPFGATAISLLTPSFQHSVNSTFKSPTIVRFNLQVKHRFVGRAGTDLGGNALQSVGLRGSDL